MSGSSSTRRMVGGVMVAAKFVVVVELLDEIHVTGMLIPHRG
jgi:hypothetical protein